MSLTIQFDGMGRFRISGGWGKRYTAKNKAELNQVIEHYFFMSQHWKKTHKNCPLCKATNNEQVKE